MVLWRDANDHTKVVSDYFWRTKESKTPPTFREYVSALESLDPNGLSLLPKRPDNCPIYTINDRVVVDRVVRFENLLSELPEVYNLIGVPWNNVLPNAKGGLNARKTKDPFWYRELYRKTEIEIISRLYEKEISTFGYEF